MSDPSTNTPDGNTSTPELTTSEYHSLLSVERRRLVIDILVGATDPVELEVLAAEVAEREDGIDAFDVTARERVAISLHHNHLPRLDDAGIAAYDSDDHVVDPAKMPNRRFDGPFALAPDRE